MSGGELPRKIEAQDQKKLPLEHLSIFQEHINTIIIYIVVI